jgi:hypothetical protein
MEPSVNESAFAARKMGEVCTSVLRGTTAENDPQSMFWLAGEEEGRHTAIMIWIS